MKNKHEKKLICEILYDNIEFSKFISPVINTSTNTYNDTWIHELSLLLTNQARKDLVKFGDICHYNFFEDGNGIFDVTITIRHDSARLIEPVEGLLKKGNRSHTMKSAYFAWLICCALFDYIQTTSEKWAKILCGILNRNTEKKDDIISEAKVKAMDKKTISIELLNSLFGNRVDLSFIIKPHYADDLSDYLLMKHFFKSDETKEILKSGWLHQVCPESIRIKAKYEEASRRIKGGYLKDESTTNQR